MKTDWMETYTGKYFYPLEPRPEDVDIKDIAHALSLLCRFNGQCTKFYSVAEHSIRVSQLVSDKNKLAALLHDSAEAYLADITRPVKRYLPYIKEIEDNILDCIFSKFDISDYDKIEIKKADNIMLATEGRDLMTNINGWFLPEPPLDEIIEPMSPQEAEIIFLSEFKRLGGKIE